MEDSQSNPIPFFLFLFFFVYFFVSFLGTRVGPGSFGEEKERRGREFLCVRGRERERERVSERDGERGWGGWGWVWNRGWGAWLIMMIRGGDLGDLDFSCAERERILVEWVGFGGLGSIGICLRTYVCVLLVGM